MEDSLVLCPARGSTAAFGGRSAAARSRHQFQDIAKSEADLFKLNEGTLGSTQIGKFATIYPGDDEEARCLVEKLIPLTRGYHGPFIVTDLKLADVVYTRYGSFAPVITRDRLGQSRPSIYGLMGYSAPTLTRSRSSSCGRAKPLPRTVVRTRQPRDWKRGRGVHQRLRENSRTGYLVLEIVKEHPRGSVFRGIDLRSSEHVGIKVIKQGRQHCMADEYGRDIRVRLQRQQALHQALGMTGVVPAADAYFEDDGDGYLPIDYVEGEDFSKR